MKTVVTKSAEETEAFGQYLAPLLKPGDVIAFYGDLGAGKTTFVRGLARGMDSSEPVSSPTFVIMHIYEGRLPIYHFDAYNLNGMDDFYDLGFDEYLEGDGVTLIEWASVISDDFPYGYIHIQIEKEEDFDKRTIYMESNDEYHESILKEWQQHENIGL